MLDQLVADPTEQITLEMAERVLGTAGNRAVGRVVQAIIDNDVAAGLDTLNTALDEGADPRQFGAQIVEYLRNVLLSQTGSSALVETSDEQRSVLAAQASALGRGALIRAVRAFNSALGDMRSSGLPQLPLELALVESTRPLAEEAPPAARPAPTRSKARPAEPEPEPETAAPAGSVSISDVKKRWVEIITATRKANAPLGAKLEHAEPKAIEGSVLVIAMHNLPLIESFSEDRNRKMVATAIHQLMNVRLAIKIVPGKGAAQGDERDQLPDDLAAFVQETGATPKFEG